MDQLLPYLGEWAGLLLRWLHITAGVAWIGASFYFIALDLSLKPPKSPVDEADGVGGEAWEIHGGGFYHVKKFRVAPPTLPDHLAWFKYEAYTTWVSGFSLLVVLYFGNAQTYLIDRRVADLSVPVAMGIAVLSLVIGWLVYDTLCRRLEKNDRLMAVLVAAFLVVEDLVLTQLLSGRAVYIVVGATIGTIMAANVFFIIIPGQRDLVAAKEAGREPDAIHGIRGKQRSVHNNYLTLPVLFAMLSNHFPMTYENPKGWLLLLLIMGLGAWFRHFFNLYHLGQVRWIIPATTVVGMVAVIALAAPEAVWSSFSGGETSGPVSFAAVQPIVKERCQVCHSETPSYGGYTQAPLGVKFDTPAQIHDFAPRMLQKAVVEKSMPLANLTNMTPAERNTLGAWIRQGAKLDS